MDHAPMNEELLALYRADQADRESPKASAGLLLRDADRLARVRAILARGEARIADDYFHAAIVFQHGHDDADYEMAHELARKASELVPPHPKARWLAAAAKDRALMKRGLPQLYGTQFRTDASGRWVLHPVDPTVTDEERARWNVPPLADAKARLNAMNTRSR